MLGRLSPSELFTKTHPEHLSCGEQVYFFVFLEVLTGFEMFDFFFNSSCLAMHFLKLETAVAVPSKCRVLPSMPTLGSTYALASVLDFDPPIHEFRLFCLSCIDRFRCFGF